MIPAQQRTRMTSGRVRLAAAYALALIHIPLLPACKTTEPVPRSARTGEINVRPGINDKLKEGNFEKWVEKFEGESREIYVHRERIADALDLRPGMAVADIGAGTGFLALLFAEKVAPNGHVTAVEIVPEFLERIQQRADEANATNVATQLCTEDSVELPASSIDVAFICDTYHHFEYPMSTMRSLFQAMKPGGRVVVVEFIRDPVESDAWVLGHVRAGQDVFIKEIEAAGFELIDRGEGVDFLEKNYLMQFRKTG